MITRKKRKKEKKREKKHNTTQHNTTQHNRTQHRKERKVKYVNTGDGAYFTRLYYFHFR